jgi:hypothetical protein
MQRRDEKFIQNFGWKESERKRSLRRHRHRWEDSAGMYLREIGCEDVD